MSLKLSAIALGIGFMFGAGSALADSATINQGGNYNDSSIEQYDNGAGVSATITTNARGNDAVVVQQMVANSSATVTQTANDGVAHVDQSGTTHRWYAIYGNNQHATINQNWGSDHDAYVKQRGNYTSADVFQGGWKNVAVVEQTGTGNQWVTAEVAQEGWKNDAYVNQKGSDLYAQVVQNGNWNKANIQQTKSGHSATITQNGNGNRGYIRQR